MLVLVFSIKHMLGIILVGFGLVGLAFVFPPILFIYAIVIGLAFLQD